MTLDDATEAAGVLAAAIAALQAAVPGQAGTSGAAFRYSCGDLLAQAPALLQAAALGAPLKACFDGAVAAGATLNGLVGVRNAVLAFSPSGQPAIFVAGTCYCLALGAEATILAGATFTSSGDAQTALAVFGGAMDAAQEWTANNGLPAFYQALVTLGAAVSRDLAIRAAYLPALTSYGFARGTTSHALAYRLYGDATRCDQLRAENGCNAPAFMPASGTALSE